jgi:hypothetical protein
MAPPTELPHLEWGERVCLRWTAWTFAGLAAVVLVGTIGMAATWWHVAGREGVGGGQRLLPTLVLLALGAVAAVACYGLSCLCRTVGRLCDDAEPSALSKPGDRPVLHRPITQVRAAAGRARQA